MGIYDDVDFFDVPDSEWSRFYDTNVLSGVRLARHYAPGMVDKGWGRILFISSESGIAIPADMINYGVTKAANLAVSTAWPSAWPARASPSTRYCLARRSPTALPPWWLKQPRCPAAAFAKRRTTSCAPLARARSFNAPPKWTKSPTGGVPRIPYSSATTGAALRVDGGVVDSLAI